MQRTQREHLAEVHHHLAASGLHHLIVEATVLNSLDFLRSLRSLRSIVCPQPVDAERTAAVLEANAQALGRQRREAQQALVADGGCGLAHLHGQPLLAVEVFHRELPHALSQRDVFAQHQAVQALRLAERNLEHGRVHAVGRSPVGVELSVGEVLRRERLAARVAGFYFRFHEQIRLQLSHHLPVEVDGVGRVSRMDEALLVDGEIQQERAVVAHGAIVEVNQVVDALHAVVFPFVVEPARAYRRVALRGHPRVAVLMAVLQFLVALIAGIDLLGTQERPVGGVGIAPFVAHPAAPGSAIAEDDGLRLQFVDGLPRPREIIIGAAVYLPRFLGTAVPAVATIGSVEPHLEHLAILREQFAQLGIEVFHVERRAVESLMAVPRREVQAQLQPVLAAGGCQLAHHVALAVLVGRVANGVVGVLRGP